MRSCFGLYVMASLYIAAGSWHLLRPSFYARIMPQWLPAQDGLILLSGVVEIALGVGLLFTTTRAWAAWVIVLMLVVFLLVHLNMALVPQAGLGLPGWGLWMRVAAQGLLIWWAWSYTR